jgi:hypothetical protein
VGSNYFTSSQDPGAPTIDVTIEGTVIFGFQVDIGSSVSLIRMKTMEELGLTNMLLTSAILKMANQTCTKPLDLLL